MDVPLALRDTSTSERSTLSYQFCFLFLQPVYLAPSCSGEGLFSDPKAHLFPAWQRGVTLRGEARHLSHWDADLPPSSNHGRKAPRAHRFSNRTLCWREIAWWEMADTEQLLTGVCWGATLQMFTLQPSVLHAVVAALITQILLFN